MKLVLIGNRFINLELINTAELILADERRDEYTKSNPGTAVRYDMLAYSDGSRYLYGEDADTLWAALRLAWKKE